MHKIIVRCCLVVALMLSLGVARGQDFPWGDFTKRSLKEIVRVDLEGDQHTIKGNNVVFHVNILSSKVEVIFVGSSRPISETKRSGFVFGRK
jgi:hypothetical protein